jgi:phosphodiesterase/alkaline phosphatase D-like protein
MAELVLGPVQRYVGETEAVVWVETDAPCTVAVRDPDGSAFAAELRTFAVEGHHYALVVIEGLEPGRTYEYAVELDGERRWPEPGSQFPPSTIRTLDGAGPVRISFGSCRVALPHERPYTLPKDEHDAGREFDALFSLAKEMLDAPRDRWPDVLLMVGDQVYADEGSPEARKLIRARRDTSRPPGEEVADYEEYTMLYRESWGDPVIRWLFSTVSCSMLIDDHDVNDDWNISRAWVEDMRRQPWWEERECSAIASYWVYQYAGNLSPRALRENRLYGELAEVDDAWPALRAFASGERDREDGERWSYCRDLNGSRLIVLDSRAGRVLDEDRRSLMDEAEWRWLEDHLEGDWNHLLIATSDPFLLAPGLHHVERWGEAVAHGAWGRLATGVTERLRRELDLDHWAAFGDSFERLARILAAAAAGRYGRVPASVVVLSGDVHHAYLAEAALPGATDARSPVWQAVCSPFRNALDRHERAMIRFGNSSAGELIGRGLARLAGIPREPIRWRLAEGPFYDNQVATLLVDGRHAELKLERTVGDPDTDERELHTSFERTLA